MRRTKKKWKFIGFSFLLKWPFMIRTFYLQRSGEIMHVRLFYANWLIQPKHWSIKGWCYLKADALS